MGNNMKDQDQNRFDQHINIAKNAAHSADHRQIHLNLAKDIQQRDTGTSKALNALTISEVQRKVDEARKSEAEGIEAADIKRQLDAIVIPTATPTAKNDSPNQQDTAALQEAQRKQAQAEDDAAKVSKESEQQRLAFQKRLQDQLEQTRQAQRDLNEMQRGREQAEARVNTAEDRASESETNAKKSEAKASEFESRAKKSDAKAMEAEDKAKKSEARANEFERRANQSDAEAGQARADMSEAQLRLEQSNSALEQTQNEFERVKSELAEMKRAAQEETPMSFAAEEQIDRVQPPDEPVVQEAGSNPRIEEASGAKLQDPAQQVSTGQKGKKIDESPHAASSSGPSTLLELLLFLLMKLINDAFGYQQQEAFNQKSAVEDSENDQQADNVEDQNVAAENVAKGNESKITPSRPGLSALPDVRAPHVDGMTKYAVFVQSNNNSAPTDAQPIAGQDKDKQDADDQQHTL